MSAAPSDVPRNFCVTHGNRGNGVVKNHRRGPCGRRCLSVARSRSRGDGPAHPRRRRGLEPAAPLQLTPCACPQRRLSDPSCHSESRLAQSSACFEPDRPGAPASRPVRSKVPTVPLQTRWMSAERRLRFTPDAGVRDEVELQRRLSRPRTSAPPADVRATRSCVHARRRSGAVRLVRGQRESHASKYALGTRKLFPRRSDAAAFAGKSRAQRRPACPLFWTVARPQLRIRRICAPKARPLPGVGCPANWRPVASSKVPSGGAGPARGTAIEVAAPRLSFASSEGGESHPSRAAVRERPAQSRGHAALFVRSQHPVCR